MAKRTEPAESVADRVARREGKTLPSVANTPSPRLPHERDESADSQNSPPHAVMKQALEDIEQGMVDTDRGPVMDNLYEGQVRTGETPARGAPSGKSDSGSTDAETPPTPPPYQSTHPVDAESVPESGRERTAESDRIRRIQQAAYAAAERRNFEPGHEVEDWLAAEREIDSPSGRQ